MRPLDVTTDQRIEQLPKFSQQFAFGLLLTLLAILARGYTFPFENHGQEIPPILAMLHPELYRNDFAIQSYLVPGVRYYYQYLIAFLVGGAGFSFAAAYFSLYFLALLSFVLATQRIALRVAAAARSSTPGLQYLAAGILVFWSLIPLNSWGSVIIDSDAIPSSFAMGITAWGIYGALQRRWVPAYAAFGLAALLQFLVGFLPGLVVLGALLMDVVRSRRWNVAVAALAVWGLGLAAVYVPMMFSATPAPADFDFLASFGLYRAPHHWSPSAGSRANWASDALLCVGALLLSWRYSKAEDERIKWLGILCGSGITIVILAVFLNYLCVDVRPVTVIGKLQFQRIIPFGHLLAFLLLLHASLAALQDRRVPAALAVIVAPMTISFGLVSAAFGISLSLKLSRTRQAVLVLTALVAYPVLEFVLTHGHSRAIGFVTPGFDAKAQVAFLTAIGLSASVMGIGREWLRRALLACGLVVALSLFIVVLSPEVPGVYQKLPAGLTLKPRSLEFVESRWTFDDTEHLPGLVLARALAAASHLDDVVLLPPLPESLCDTFELLSRRAAFFAHKNVPFDDYHVWMWAERAKSLLGVSRLKPFMTSPERAALFAHRASGDLERIARENRACFVVSRADWHKFTGQILAHERIGANDWLLWQLTDCGR